MKEWRECNHGRWIAAHLLMNFPLAVIAKLVRLWRGGGVDCGNPEEGRREQ